MSDRATKWCAILHNPNMIDHVHNLVELADFCAEEKVAIAAREGRIERGAPYRGLEILAESEGMPGEKYVAEPDEEIEQTETLLPSTFPDLLDPTTLEGQPVPHREWHVEPLIPHRTVTLLSGDGGTGKSLLALQLTVSTALSSSWIGRVVAAGCALYVSAEDDEDEVHRRLVDICAAEGARLSDLENLKIRILAGLDAVLAAPTGKAGLIEETPLWATLVGHCEAIRPRLLVLDTLADLYAGDENNRTQVRQFIGLLRGLAMRFDMTVLLLSHPSLTGLNSGSGTSGSTAWNNSVRSRLYLSYATSQNGNEPDPDLRTLKTMKANYGARGDEIVLRWRKGRFVVEKGTFASAFDRVAAEGRAEQVFLNLLGAYAYEGRAVSANISKTYAPAVFAKDTRSKGIHRDALEAAMNRLFEAGRIKSVTSGPPSKQRTRIVPRDPHEEDNQ